METKHSNQLKFETSPYLLQHAHNPVHWFAWGDEALNAARLEDKPILVSIGYAACHWCHVMEKESFENEEVAKLMNEYFINIKIDREERPDLDHIYMDAVQAIAGNGGWPLNVFLTPEAKPFFGGTYFPPQKAFNRPSWTDVLHSIHDAWQNRRTEIEEQAGQLIEHIKKANGFGITKNIFNHQQPSAIFSEDACKTIAENLLKTADKAEGGFGKAPKFPQTFSIQYLLQYAHLFKDDIALNHAGLSLQKMVNGGIYDQLAGGLCRYSTDNNWLVPHFEKMLYDNALLINVLCDAYQGTKDDFYKNATIKTINFIYAEMKDKDGGYYSAIDADSEGVEGKFYVWQKNEIEQLLEANSKIYCAYYNVTGNGNWEGHNILHIKKDANQTANEWGVSINEFTSIIEEANKKLLAERNTRVRPITDDKILLGWNALLITAFCKAYAALQNEAYKLSAIELFNFLETHFVNKTGEGMYHTYKNGQAKHPAFLDDYASYIQACIFLQEITGDQQYLWKAKELSEYVTRHFKDEESAFLFYTNQQQNDIVVRKIELYDGATASANSIMANNLLYLSIVFDNRQWHRQAIEMISSIAGPVKKYPGSFAVWAAAILQQISGIYEIAIVGKQFTSILKEALLLYIPNKILQSSKHISEMPLLAKKPVLDDTLIYLCKNYECKPPISTINELLLLINK